MSLARFVLPMLIFAIAVSRSTVLETLRLSSPRSAVRAIEVEDKLYFVGGYEYNDQVATNKIEIFDLKTNQWDPPLTLERPRGFISPHVQEDNIYFVGGNLITNPPAYYDLDLHTFVSFNSSGPTVRAPISVSIHDNTLVVIGRFSVDFMDMGNGTWNHSAQLTSVMQQLSSSVAFSHEELVFVIGGINTTTRQQESRAWLFNISSNELKPFENVISSSVNTTRPFKFEVTHGIVTACFSDACIAYHIASSRWIEQLAPIILTCVSVPDKTFIFEPTGFWTVDWLLSDIDPSWTPTTTNITFAFGVASQACYIAPNISEPGTLLVVYENNSWQEQSAPFGLFIVNVWKWTDSRVVIASNESSAIHFYESTTRSFLTVNLNLLQITAKAIPFNESMILTMSSTPDNYYSVVSSDGSFQHISRHPALNNAYMLIGTDLIDHTSSNILSGMDSNPSYVNNRVLYGTVTEPLIWARKGNLLVGIRSIPITSFTETSYRAVDVYNYKTKSWSESIRYSDPITPPVGIKSAVTKAALYLFGNQIRYYEFASRNWTVLPVFITMNRFQKQSSSAIVNGSLYVASSPAILTIINADNSFTRDTPGTIDYFTQMFIYNDKELFFNAGAYPKGYSTTIYSYNIETRVWQAELLPQGDADLAMALTRDLLVCIGLSDNKIAYYHIPTRAWLDDETPFDTSYSLSAIITLSNGTVVFGGGTHRELSHYSDEITLLTIDRSDTSMNVTEPQSGGLTEGELAAAIAVPIVASLIAAALIVIFVIRNKKNKKNQSSNTLGLENKYGTWFVDFNQIKFGDQLGQGGSGQVFKGTWKNTTVALKVSMTQANSSVIHELELMMQLRPHPNVVQLLGFSVHPETESIILMIEFCNGGSLDKTLYDSTNEISSEQKRQWLLSIAKGLSHLHSNNIVHRDVAARNVLLHQNEAKITDFGMSRLVDEEKQRGTTKSELGPIRWMSPESLKDRQYSTKSDVWSYGIFAYEVIAQQEPHTQVDPIQAGRLIRDQGLTPALPKSTPPALQSIIARCWQKVPEDRPTIDQIIQDIEKIEFSSF